MHNITVGSGHTGSPVVGDYVFIGPGSIVFGGISIGNNVAIGPNSVIFKDIHENGVVGGNPAKLISEKCSEYYVRNRVE